MLAMEYLLAIVKLLIIGGFYVLWILVIGAIIFAALTDEK